MVNDDDLDDVHFVNSTPASILFLPASLHTDPPNRGQSQIYDCYSLMYDYPSPAVVIAFVYHTQTQRTETDWCEWDKARARGRKGMAGRTASLPCHDVSKQQYTKY